MQAISSRRQFWLQSWQRINNPVYPGVIPGIDFVGIKRRNVSLTEKVGLAPGLTAVVMFGKVSVAAVLSGQVTHSQWVNQARKTRGG